MAEAVKFEDKVTPEQTQQAVITKRADKKGRKTVEKNLETLERLNVKYVSVDDIHPNEWNPNRQSEHDFELLLRSMEEDGFTQPVITNEEFKIVDGEHRWRAGKALGFKEIPVVTVKMSEEQMRISTIRHNRARGSHDIELEAEVLRDLQKLGAIDWAQDSLMLDDTELNMMLEDIAAPDALAGEDFSEAWVPEKFSEEDKKIISEGGGTAKKDRENLDGTTTSSAMTQKAVDEQRRREKLIAEAKTEQEREWAKRDTRLYRVALVFSGDESEIVKEALGDEPATALLEFCKDHLGQERVAAIEAGEDQTKEQPEDGEEAEETE